MNRDPVTKGINKHWVPGVDDKVLIAKYSKLDQDQVDAAISALWRVLTTKKKSVLVGFGTFEWKRWHNRLPTGKFVKTWRLAFKPCRYTAQVYEGTET